MRSPVVCRLAVPVALVPDGAGGAFVRWTDGSTSATIVRRITPAGLPASGWPATGITMCTFTGHGFLGATRIGAGGVIAFFDVPFSG